MTKTKALYGFSPELAPFEGKAAAEQVALLRAWGANAVFGGYQRPDFIEAAHAVGLQVYAEFGVFIHEHWWNEVPGSRPITAEGIPLPPEDWYYGVNPAHPVVRRRQLNALEAFLSQHPVDGVWLDFIRWPCHWESPAPNLPQTSFDALTLERFRADAGIAVPTEEPVTAAEQILTHHRKEWTAWRCEQITAWVAAASDVAARIRPTAILGLFGIPWRRTDFDGAILNVIGQDYAALGAHVDVISPMVYHVMCGHPVAWIEEVTDEVHTLSNCAVWPTIQSVNEPQALPPVEYAEALETALTLPTSSGIIVFTLKGALSDQKLSRTKAAFTKEHYPRRT